MSEENKNLKEEERKELKENLKNQIDEMSDDELDKVAGGASHIYTKFHIEAYYYSAWIDYGKYDPDLSDLVPGEVAATSDLRLKIGDRIENMNLKIKKIIDVNSAPKGSGIYTRAMSAYRLNDKIEMIIYRPAK